MLKTILAVGILALLLGNDTAEQKFAAWQEKISELAEQVKPQIEGFASLIKNREHVKADAGKTTQPEQIELDGERKTTATFCYKINETDNIECYPRPHD